MADLNIWLGVGRLGRDPELRTMQSGDAVCNASIAVGRKWRDKNSGETKEQTTWVPLAFWGKSAELFAQYARKGSQIRVNGELTVRKYTDKDGMERTMTEIKVADFQLLGGKPEGGGGAPAAAQQRQAPAQRPAQSDMDSDIPF